MTTKAQTELAYSSAGAGPAVVLLHGLAGFKELWREQVPHLNAAGFRVIAIDLPGHGASPDPTGPFTIGDAADGVAHVLDRLGIAQAAIVGHSMGGRTMFTFAVERPDRLWAIVPVGAQSEAPRAEYRRVLLDLRAKTVNGGMPAFRTAFLEAGEIPERTGRDPAFAEWYWAAFDRNRATSLVRGLDAIFAMPATTSRLGLIHAPALSVVGAEDGPFIPYAKRYEQLLPHCRTVIVEGCRHYPMTDAEPRFSRLLTEFLSQNRPRAALAGVS